MFFFFFTFETSNGVKNNTRSLNASRFVKQYVTSLPRCLQERTGVKMVMIQDGPMPTGADKPLRISGDPYKVQASPLGHVSRGSG